MMRRLAAILVVPLLTAGSALAAPSTTADLTGTWAGFMTHDGERQPIAMTLEPDRGDTVRLRLTIPIMHVENVPFGRAPVTFDGDTVRIGLLPLRFDPAAGTLTGLMPRSLVPLYAIPLELRRTDRFDMPPRPPLTAPAATPLWTFEAGSALWAGPAFANGLVFAGAQDGRVIALDAHDGRQRWEFATGGAIRCRPVPAYDAVFVQSDDGFLYALDAASGHQRWRVPTVASPIVRLPFSDPKSRYDRFGSDVTVAGKRLYVGTHEGRLLALDLHDGHTLWSFTAGDAILAAPALDRGTLYFGSYDHRMYAVDAATGALRWEHDTGGAVVSTPAVYDGRVIVGTRAYDLLALDAETGAERWKRYVWMSWVESSPVVRDGIVYVGSSDAAALFAVVAKTGKPLWTTDVFGWAWGRPAVDARRVYTGVSSQAGYPVGHAGGVLALDRATGIPLWRYAPAAPDTGAWGFPGSPALGMGRVFVSGLDGRVLAFGQ